MSCTFSIKPNNGSTGSYDKDNNYWLFNFDQFGKEIDRKKEGDEKFASVWIYIDNSNTNNSFYQTETKGGWFDVERRRNEIRIRVEPNFTTDERDGFVEFAHNCDASKTCQICIHQCATEYQISADITLTKAVESGTDKCGNEYSAGVWIDNVTGCVSDVVTAATESNKDECGNEYSVGDWIYTASGCKVGDANATELNFKADVVEFENWNIEDSRVIAIATKGGSGRFYVKSVKQYQENGICIESKEITTQDDNGNETTTYECKQYQDLQVEYDEGLKLILEQPEECVEDGTEDCPNCTGNGKLTIRSYGRTFVDEDNYYIITLAHLDYRFRTCEIKVKYKLPDRTLCLSSDKVLFDYNRKLLAEDDTSDSQTVSISFCEKTDGCETCEEHPDYGYEIEMEDCDWLTVTENPTSLTFECEINPTQEDRSIEIKVYSVDDPTCSATLTVTQNGFVGYDVMLSDERLVADYDDTQTYEVLLYVYAYTYDGDESETDEFWETYVENAIRNACADDDGTWATISYGGYRNTDFFTEVTLNVKFNPNSGTADRECSIKFTHPTKSDKTTELTILQYAEGNYKVISEGEIGTYNSDDKTITISMNAVEGASYYLIASSTASWCSAVIDGDENLDVVLKCTPNYWKETRYCVVTVTDTINSTVYRYKVTQEYCDEKDKDDEGNPTCDPYEFKVDAITEDT